jgi:competence ComEA-like helix-hairpin-helix protein
MMSISIVDGSFGQALPDGSTFLLLCRRVEPGIAPMSPICQHERQRRIGTSRFAIGFLRCSLLACALGQVAPVCMAADAPSDFVGYDGATTTAREVLIRPNIPLIINRPPRVGKAVGESPPDLESLGFLSTAINLSNLTGVTSGTRPTSAPRYLRMFRNRPPRQTPKPSPEADKAGESSPEFEELTRDLLNVNVATTEQLRRVEGMDERRARAIILFRTLHGPFDYLDQLSEVFGITEDHVDAWREELTAPPPESDPAE